ncbi:MAG: TIGR03943 family protein [Chthoniobacteraceae bacterium]
MNKLFTRWLPCATLATWSAILIGFYLTGRVRDFLAPEFRPGVLVAGFVMGAMALTFLLFPADASCCSSASCGHSLSRLASGKVLTFLILLLPITTAAMFSPESFSSNVVKNRGVITDASALGGRGRSGPPAAPELPLPTNQPTPPAAETAATQSTPPAPAASAQPSQPPAVPGDYLQRTPEGTIIVEVLDLLYAAQDNALRKDFEGKAVQLIGQLMPDTSNNANGNRFKAVRMFMTCCAADARPVATLVEAEKKPEMPEMSWVKITGTATFPIENGRRIAILKSDKVEATKPPDESMLY